MFTPNISNMLGPSGDRTPTGGVPANVLTTILPRLSLAVDESLHLLLLFDVN